MNQPQVHMGPPDPELPPASVPTWILFACTASCMELTLVIYFTYGNVYVLMLFSQIIPTLAFSCWVHKSVHYIWNMHNFNLVICSPTSCPSSWVVSKVCVWETMERSLCLLASISLLLVPIRWLKASFCIWLFISPPKLCGLILFFAYCPERELTIFTNWLSLKHKGDLSIQIRCDCRSAACMSQR